MSELYTVMLAVLAILAVSGLYVGVTNDAVNFLNAAIGAKVAKMRTILAVASVGIILGVLTSSGMMEVARSGMFNPGLFTFHEIMVLYVSVMFANVILLDIYNSLGLPTSTTVALVFSLLGAAISVSLFKIGGDPTLHGSYLGNSAFGVDCLHLWYDRYVAVTPTILVPLLQDFPQIGSYLVRNVIYGYCLFRSLQGFEGRVVGNGYVCLDQR